VVVAEWRALKVQPCKGRDSVGTEGMRLLGRLGERRELPPSGLPQTHFQHRAALAEGKMQHFLPHIFSET